MTPERAGVVALDGWAGRTEVPVTVVGETPTRYRVRRGAAATLPGYRRRVTGDVVLVPRAAVRITEG